MPNPKDSKPKDDEKTISRDRLAELLTEDLAREYQAIIAHVVYSQVLIGAQYMSIADQLQLHAPQELQHALTLSRQIDYLGKMPTVTPKQVKTSEDARQMLRFDLDKYSGDRLLRQAKMIGDLFVGHALRDQGDELLLPPRESNPLSYARAGHRARHLLKVAK